jgi:Outer membrane protein beta-barrel domain
MRGELKFATVKTMMRIRAFACIQMVWRSHHIAINDSYGRFLLRKFAFVATVFTAFALPNLASAQQADAMFGFGTVMSPGAAQCESPTSASAQLPIICPEKGGLFTNLGGDVIFHRRFGIGFDATWRTSQGNFGNIGQPYRPIIFDFNGVYQPRLGKKAGLDLMGGIGWQTTRFYLPYCTNGFTCNNYVSSNHFLVDLGAGLRYYVWGHVFVRPEARYYKVFNNSDYYTSGNIIHVGASIGYTIGPD